MPVMDDPKLIEILTRLEVKLDNLASTYADHLTDHTDHELRLRDLEKKVWRIPSATVVINALAMAAQYLALHR